MFLQLIWRDLRLDVYGATWTWMRGEGTRTGKTCGFLEGNPHFRGVPAAVAAIQEERWIPKRVRGQYSTIGRFWGIRRHDDQGVLARRAQETVPGTSIQRTGQQTGLLAGLDVPILFSSNACARNFEQAIWTIVPADFDGDTSVAPYRIAFLAEVEVVDFVIRVRG